MWPFKTPKKEQSYEESWKKEMLLRWTDLEARVTSLELVDKEYKKRARRKLDVQSEDLNSSVILPV